ncbi:MAG: rod shape-determining protein MreD [Nitriliruptoraceae bacterium]
MIARPIVIGLALIIAVTLQTALFPLLPTGWFRPDLLLLLVVAVALEDGPLPGMRIGFAAGLVTDLLVTLSPAGVATLVMTVIGTVIGTIRPYLAPSSLTAPLFIAFASGLLGTATYGTLALLLGDDRVTGTMLVQSSVAVALYNAVLAPVVIGPVGRLLRKFPRQTATAVD